MASEVIPQGDADIERSAGLESEAGSEMGPVSESQHTGLSSPSILDPVGSVTTIRGPVLHSPSIQSHDPEYEDIISRIGPTSRTMSLGPPGPSQSEALSSAMPSVQNPELQRRLNKHDKRLYELVNARKEDRDGLRALVLTDSALKYTAGAAMNEFYDFYNLQACNIIDLRKSLATVGGNRNLLTYLSLVNALRDIEYTFSKKPVAQATEIPDTYGPMTNAIISPQPKEGTGGPARDDAGIQRALQFANFDEETKALLTEFFETGQRWLRFGVAAVGAIALIVPMLIMTLHPGRNTSVITTSVAVSIVTAGISFLKLEAGNVLLFSAAYAAVLVVFVGASLQLQPSPASP